MQHIHNFVYGNHHHHFSSFINHYVFVVFSNFIGGEDGGHLCKGKMIMDVHHESFFRVFVI